MATSNSYSVTVLVTDAKTKSGVPGLRVEAWDKDLIFDDLLGSAVTGPDGKAVFTFDKKYFAELFLDRKPDIYFKLFLGDKLIFSTEKTTSWNVSSRTRTVNVVIPATVELPEGILNGSVSSFLLSGTVVDADRKPVRARRLVAVDVDLKGAAVYRSVTKLSEISGEGFELLGDTVSDERGFYSIPFSIEQYRLAERGKADAVVYAVDGEKIVGRSRLVAEKDYDGRGEVNNLHVLVSRTDGRTEYDLLMSKLQPFLEASKVSLADLAKSAEQIDFTASELDENAARIRLASEAEIVRTTSQTSLPVSHEMLYGIGRQQIQMSWISLFKRKDDELRAALVASAKANIIREFSEEDITAFLQIVHDSASAYSLEHVSTKSNTNLDQLLANALPDKKHRLAFANAARSFSGNNYQEFWNDYLPGLDEFKNNPKLISSLLLTQQLTLISGNHNALINELQVKRKILKATDLMGIGQQEWDGIFAKTGIPEFIKADTEAERSAIYATQIQNVLNAAFPTQRITLMLDRKEIPIESSAVANDMTSFLKSTESFDFSSSRVHDFEKEIIKSSPKNHAEVKTELKRIQRVFQVSTKPEAMSVLLENKLDSAYAITSVPKKSFVAMYSMSLGGNIEAEAIYERAAFMSTRSSEHAMKAMEYSHSQSPESVLPQSEHSNVMTILQNHIPNYSELFGSPDICECEHCRSVYSAAAYFVDLLRYLWRGTKNANNKSPLDMFAKRRPDLLNLPLTCENTNTVIPYIDLVNEVMEYYTYHESILPTAAFDTGETTAEELRANPQHVEPEAYKKLAAAVYPFSLPYHQPLDVIRTYTDHLQTSRYDLMKTMQKSTVTPVGLKAIEAEALRIGQEEYAVLTGKKFDGSNDTKQLHQYYGYAVAGELEQMAGTGVTDGIHEFLRRSGMKYTDLVELVKTKFINPYQFTLDYLEKLFADCPLSPAQIYQELKNIDGGTPPQNIPAIKLVLDNAGVNYAKFDQWVNANLSHFDKVITLYQSDSMCDLNTTYLRTLGNVYAGVAQSGINAAGWSKIHRFIRLWRKLGWKLHEVDLMLDALGQTDITPATISLLSSMSNLAQQLKLQINMLATIWGNIDTYGEKSLYKKLFLNKSVQNIDQSFEADKFGNYLPDNGEKLGDHIPAILAAFRMSGEDLQAILDMEIVVENNVLRKLNPALDKLSLANLSSIYRYAVLSKALKLKVADACLLIRLFAASPFSNWDITQDKYINISPAATTDFCTTVLAVKKAAFKPEVLQYILNGKVSPESTLGINTEKARLAARAIHEAFALIAQDYPDVPANPLSVEQIKNYLLLSFNAEIVNQMIGYIESQQNFSVTAELNLNVVIPALYTSKYQYTNASGILSCAGIMGEADHTAILNAQTFNETTDINLMVVIPAPLSTKFTYDNPTGKITCLGMMSTDERMALSALANVNDNFRAALDILLSRCDHFKETLTALFTITNEHMNASLPSGAVATPGLGAIIPAPFAPKITYNDISGRIICRGVMTTAEYNVLHLLGDAAFKAGIDSIYKMPDTFLAENFSGVFSNMNAALITLVNHPAQPVEVGLDAKLQLVYDSFIPLLRRKLREDSIAQHIAALLGLNEESTAVLVQSDLATLTESLAKEGFGGKYYSGVAWGGPVVLNRIDAEINFEWTGSPGGAVPANGFSTRWESYLTPPSSGDYTFVVAVNGTDETFDFYLDDIKLFSKTGADLQVYKESLPVTLNASKMYRVRLDYTETSGNAGLSLSWKTATTAETIIPSIASLPAAEVDAFVAIAGLYHRATKFISGFKLDTRELAHLIRYKTSFAGIDFKALTAAHWKRISDYTKLRGEIPQTQATLIDVFETAEINKPALTIDNLINLLNLATAWDINVISYLVKTHFVFTKANFKNEIELVRLGNAVRLVQKAGIPVDQLADPWSVPETTDFNALNITAQLAKSAVKAKYEEADWLSLAGGLSDKIRENQKQALIGYLLTRDELKAWGATDADGLFEYFLIDVQMGACMDTSRIVQANSSVQMFVNRCLLNLESERSTGVERGVSPDAVDTERWEWMKYYRVWEANRKVFLYPENWLEPEWRDDRSPFFKELESELVQNDITTRSVENAFRNYLTKLNDVAHPNVFGTYTERDTNGSLKLTHVIARSHTVPYHFYYRTWNDSMKWNAWEKMPVDIRGVESGEYSGVHVIPVKWKDRLFVFWPEFTEQHRTVSQVTDGHTSSVREMAEKTPGQMKPIRYWEVRLAWTERVDDKWSPKQSTKEFVTLDFSSALEPYDFTFKTEISADGLSIKPFRIELNYEVGFEWLDAEYFFFEDIQANVQIRYDYDTIPFQYDSSAWYFNSYEKHSGSKQLGFWGNTYFNQYTNHKLLFSNDSLEKETFARDPFFFQDEQRTYFVRTFDTTIIKQVQNPGGFFPPIVDIIDDSWYTQPHFPGVTPDDYLPGPEDVFGGINIIDVDGGFTDPVRGGMNVNVFGANKNFEVKGMQNKVVQPAMFNAKPAGGEAPQPMMFMRSSSDNSSTGFNYESDANINDYVSIENSFSGSIAGNMRYGFWWDNYYTTIPTKGLEFHTFYHPYSSDYVKRLNKGGVPGLMESDTKINGDSGSHFAVYDPNFANELVRKAPVSNAYKPGEHYTYYKENVCFDVFGANSIYNWELFFHAPLYIATRLSKNGKYEEAMKWFHYIFDPTTNELPLVGQAETSRYWKVLPFKTTPSENLETWLKGLGANTNPAAENAVIKEWRKNPFMPHLIARNRPLAYMKNVVLKYVENLVAWADSLFRMFTMESVNEALQIYVIANHILGPRPQFVPKRGEIKAQTYNTLKNKWDDFSNALVELENIFPYSSSVPVGDSGSGANLLGVGPALYFCIPGNEKLMEYWDTVTDRLFKIRHCMNIDGVEMKLSLFAPAIDPGMLVNAAAQGLSLGSILADLSSPAPIYRFSYLLQRANEFCNEVKSLGSTLLGVLEKKDGEELGRLRATHEGVMLELMTEIKERQVLEARSNRDGLLKNRETAKLRLDHYTALLGNADISIAGAPSLSADLNSESSLPADTSIAMIVPDVDQTLVGSDERGVKLISREKEDIDKGRSAMISQQVATALEGAAGIAHFFPAASIDGKPFGIGGGVSFGGPNIGSAISAAAKIPQIIGAVYAYEAGQAAKMASFIRREQDWTLQANLAAREIIQVDKQLASSEIRLQITQKELENHKKQIENAKEVEQFLYDKFTNQELYQWMKEQLFAVYKQAYNMAYDMAKKVEKCYRYELGNPITSFIQYGYWDNSHQGLCSGEKLQLSLRQMEKSYIEENKRELELSRNVSMALLNPLALQQLRSTGKCTLAIPEELFDMDYAGHYFRRIKSVSLSIPCIAGPYTTVSCTLRLMKNAVRINTSMNEAGTYEHENEDGIWIDDDRFRSSNVPVKAIAASSGQRDTGMFELNFRDERYLPFEGAGAISEWKIELTADSQLRQFDYTTISDVIMHINYTAREDAGLFKTNAVTYIKEFLSNAAELSKQPLMRMFSLKHDFSTEWYRFLHPAAASPQVFNATLKPDHFPFFTHGRSLVISKIDFLIRAGKPGDYKLIFSATDLDNVLHPSAEISAPENATYGNMQKASIAAPSGTLDLGEMDVFAPLSLKIKHSSQAGYAALGTNPDELSDVFVVLHYALGE